MKLVEILARELAEWPCDGPATQDPDKEVRFECCSADFYSEILADDAGDDYGMGDEVTREQWQAERDKLIQPQAEEVEMVPTHMVFGYGSKEDMISQIGDVDPFVQVANEFKFDQIEGPIKWRDTIIHCQAVIEDCEREIERNVQMLDAEGLMMQKDSKKAMQHYVPDVVPSAEWQVGDVVECKHTDYPSFISIGSRYKITGFDNEAILFLDDQGDDMDYLSKHFKFHSRP